MSTPCEMRSLGDGAQGDEALDGAESNADNLGVFRWAAHEGLDGTRGFSIAGYLS